MQNKKSDSSKKNNLLSYANLLSLGIEMSAAMLIPIFGGYYLEKHVSITPWGIVVGAIFGFVSAFWLVYKRVVLHK